MLTDEPDAWDEVRVEPAGLFEGEGCLTLSNGWPRVKLCMTDEDTVRRFHEAVNVGQVRVDDAGLKRGYKRQWEWYVANRAGVIEVVYLLWPWLNSRRSERAYELLVAAGA